MSWWTALSLGTRKAADARGWTTPPFALTGCRNLRPTLLGALRRPDAATRAINRMDIMVGGGSPCATNGETASKPSIGTWEMPREGWKSSALIMMAHTRRGIVNGPRVQSKTSTEDTALEDERKTPLEVAVHGYLLMLGWSVFGYAQPMECDTCDNTGFVCEAHPNRPWNGPCGCGAAGPASSAMGIGAFRGC